MDTIYLDHISAAPLHPEVKRAMIDYLDDGFGNPVSQHHIGDAAVEALEGAREEVAKLINANPQEVVFTSGGTESISIRDRRHFEYMTIIKRERGRR